MPSPHYLVNLVSFQSLLGNIVEELDIEMCEIRITFCRECGTLFHHYQMACPLVHIPKFSSQVNRGRDMKRTCGVLTKKKNESAVPCRECLEKMHSGAIRPGSEGRADEKGHQSWVSKVRGQKDAEWARSLKEQRDRLVGLLVQSWRDKVNERKKAKRSREEVECDLKTRIRFVQSSNLHNQAHMSPGDDTEEQDDFKRCDAESSVNLGRSTTHSGQDQPSSTDIPDWQDLEAATLSRYESAEHNVPMWQDPRNSITPQSPDPWSQGIVYHTKASGTSRAEDPESDVDKSSEPLSRWETTPAAPPRRYSRALEGLEKPHPSIQSIINNPTTLTNATRTETPMGALCPSPLFSPSSSPYRPSSPFSIVEGMATTNLLSRLTIIEEAGASREALRELDEALKRLEADECPPIPPRNPARVRRHSAVYIDPD